MFRLFYGGWFTIGYALGTDARLATLGTSYVKATCIVRNSFMGSVTIRSIPRYVLPLMLMHCRNPRWGVRGSTSTIRVREVQQKACQSLAEIGTYIIDAVTDDRNDWHCSSEVSRDLYSKSLHCQADCLLAFHCGSSAIYAEPSGNTSQ
jgi:hypothetical protein